MNSSSHTLFVRMGLSGTAVPKPHVALDWHEQTIRTISVAGRFRKT